jgi:CRISPR/Cas system-associated endonuclease Cas1
MSKANSNAMNHEVISPVGRTFMANDRGPICVVDGQVLSIHIDRGHLIVADGIGRYRRERRYHKATYGLTRIVVVRATGTLSLDALRYCDGLGIAVIVMDPLKARPSFISMPNGIDDARLRRVQALAPDSGLGVEIAKSLLGAKVDRQAKVLHNSFDAVGAETTIRTLRDGLASATSFDEMRQIEASAAACYFNEWSGSPRVVRSSSRRIVRKYPTIGNGTTGAVRSSSPTTAIGRPSVP